MRLKICGIKSEDDIKIINKYMPDYAGFVFAESKRRVECMQAKSLIKKLEKKIKSVGVFVNEEMESLIYTAEHCGLYAVQLHGDEDENYIEKVKFLTDIKIIKCIRTKDKESVISGLNTNADFILFDAYGKLRGGTGKRADFKLIEINMDKINKPFFIAGGINASNAAEAIKLNPFALDISSGVEAATGGKDEKMVAELFSVLSRV